MPATHSLLLVDDDHAVLFTLQMILEKARYSVTTAGTAREALKLMQNTNEFDAIVTDLHMETERSGFEIAEAAARLSPRPVIVLLTGYATNDNAKAAMNGSVDHVEFKPFGLDNFKHALQRLLAVRDDRLQRP